MRLCACLAHFAIALAVISAGTRLLGTDVPLGWRLGLAVLTLLAVEGVLVLEEVWLRWKRGRGEVR